MKLRHLLLAALLGLAVPLPATAASPAAALPGDSAYRLADTYTDQAGRDFRLADGRGRVRLVAMFYTSCRYVCPLIIDSAKGVEHALTPAERARLGVLLVSLDPARDDVAALRSVFDKRRLDPARWTLLTSDELNIQELAVLLNMKYKNGGNGEIAHSNIITVLNAGGEIIHQQEGLGKDPDETVKTIDGLLKSL